MIRLTPSGRAVSLLAGISAFFFALPAAAISPGAGFSEVWKTSEYGQGIGIRALEHIDVDGDGRAETIFSSILGYHYPYGAEAWSVQEYVPAKHRYRIRWQSPVYTSGLTALKAFPSPPGSRIYVGLGDGTVEIFDAFTLTRIAAFSTSGPVLGFEMGDADNNGSVDLVVLHDSSTELFDPASRALRRTIPYGGQSFGLGDVDGNGRLDLVFSTGHFITQRGPMTVMKWDNSAIGFGDELVLADVDADGKAEIVCREGRFAVRAVDADVRLVKWERAPEFDLSAMRLADVTGDGKVEVLYGDGQWGSIHVLDSSDGSDLWSVSNPDYGVTRIDAFDADDDGLVEILWSSGDGGPSYLRVAALRGSMEWRSEESDGAFLSDVGDVDGDGKPDIVTAGERSDGGYGDGIISIYGASTHALKWRSYPYFFHGAAWTGLHDLKLADLDADGVMEILVATDRLYDRAIYVIDGRTRTLRSEFTYDYDPGGMRSLATGDVDGDGAVDIVAGDSQRVNVFSPQTGALKWQSHSFGWVDQVRVANVDDDPAMEIIALANNRLHMFDGQTHEYWQSTNGDYTAFVLSEANDGKVRAYAGTGSGQLWRLRFRAGTETLLDSFCGSSIEALALRGGLYYACGGQVGTYDLGSKTLTKLSAASDPGLGYSNSISFIDNNGHVVLGGRYRVIEFKPQ